MAAILNFGSKPFSYFSFPQCLDATYEIWLHLAQWFQRRIRLKVWTDDRRTTEASHTKSSPGAFGLGELKSCLNGLKSRVNINCEQKDRPTDRQTENQTPMLQPASRCDKKCCDLSSGLSWHSGSQTFRKYKSIKPGKKIQKWCTANSKVPHPPLPPHVNGDTTILMSVHLQTFCIGWQRITSDFSYQLAKNNSFVLKT